MSNTYYMSLNAAPNSSHKSLLNTPLGPSPITINLQFPSFVQNGSYWHVQAGVDLDYSNAQGHTIFPPPLSTSGAFRTTLPIIGTLDKGNYVVTIPIDSLDGFGSAYDEESRIVARLWKSSDPTGAGAIAIDNGAGYSNTIHVTDGAPSTIATVTMYVTSKANFSNEYLFIDFGFQHIKFNNMGSWPMVLLNFGVVGSKLVTPAFITNVSSEQVCSPFGQREMYIYISPDGEQYPLDVDGSRVVLNDQGTGVPPLDIITQRGPLQHGESLIATYAKPRVVQLMILHKYNNRDSWWNGRANLVKQLSPRKQASDGANDPGVLRRVLSTGEKRDLNCMIQEGPKFNPRGDGVWDELSYTEALRFIGLDPIYYDPTVQIYIFDKQASQLTFPIVFPISFSTIHQTVPIQYQGSWLCYPKFIITGPMTYVKLWNMTTDEVIELTYNLDDARTITIDLQYGSKAVLLDDNTNLFPYVRHDTDIGTFHLTEVNDGVNQFHVHMVGVMANSQVQLQYNPRYLGI